MELVVPRRCVHLFAPVNVNQNVARVDDASPWNFWMGFTECGVQSPGRLADYFRITAAGFQNHRCSWPGCSQAPKPRVNQDAIAAFAVKATGFHQVDVTVKQ